MEYLGFFYLDEKGEGIMKKLIITLVVICVLFLSGLAHANLEEGLIAYYPFNGNANDQSGNGNDGTVYGATLTEDRFGNLNNAYSFDGNDDKVVLFESYSRQNQESFGLWAKVDDPAAYSGRIMSCISKSWI